MATAVPTNKAVTLTDEEYTNLATNAAEEVLRLIVEQRDKWLPTSHSDENCQVSFYLIIIIIPVYE